MPLLLILGRNLFSVFKEEYFLKDPHLLFLRIMINHSDGVFLSLLSFSCKAA